MNIVFIVDDYSGGAGNIVQLLASEYAKTDTVSVILTHNTTTQKRYPCEKVRFYALSPEQKPKGKWAKLRFQVAYIKEKIQEINPDVILSFLTINSIFTALGQWNGKIPLIACERICPSDLHLKFPWDFLMKVAYRRADILTVQFQAFTSLYNGKYVDKIAVTPNYIATPDRFWKERGADTVRFISCGRLNSSKQFELLLEMFSEIHEKKPASELMIYGKGPYEERLKARIEALGLSDSARLCGYTDKTYEVLCDADIYLMSSKSEGFPNALSEALAVGMPSVSFRCNRGIDELCDYGRRGITVDANDRKAFIEAALLLAEKKEERERLSANAKEVTEIYNLEAVKKTWDDCMEKAIQKRRKT